MKLIKPGMKASARWAVLRRMVLRRTDGIVYLDRIRLVQTPWFAVYLHRFDGPDPGRDLHDHPWPFATVVLSGGYTEDRADIRTPGVVRSEHRRAWRPRVMRMTECHTIRTLDRTPTRTLVVAGRRRRSFGFYTPTGWQHYTAYEQDRQALTYDTADGAP